MYKLCAISLREVFKRCEKPVLTTTVPAREKVRAILEYPHESLKHRAEPVMKMNDEFWTDVEDLLDTFYRFPGAQGLAAPQLNILKRIIVLNSKETVGREPLVLVNPTIENPRGGLVAIWETCLSFPQLEIKVPRARQVTVSALNLEGERISLEADKLLSVAAQHEVDHLDGKVLLDYLPADKRAQWIQSKSRHSL